MTGYIKGETYLVPGNLDETTKEFLRWNFWKEEQIEAFMKHFENLKNGKISTLEEFKKILSLEENLKTKKVNETFEIGLVFCNLEHDFKEEFIKKLAEESIEERRNDPFLREINEEFFGENPEHLEDVPQEYLDENPYLKKFKK